MLQLGDLSNPELRILTDQLDKIRYGGKLNTNGLPILKSRLIELNN